MKIGVFDSGHGGLTVLDALVKRFPEHSFVYLGDHSHAPYGSRDASEILDRALLSVDWLFDQDCRLVLLACNTASAVALRPLQQGWLQDHAPEHRVLGVLVPMVEAITGVEWQVKDAASHPAGALRRVGLLATPSTVASECFPGEISLRAPEIQVIQQACPALVSRIEDGVDRDRLGGLVRGYVEALLQKTVPNRLESVVLGCTHYQLIADLFRQALPEDIRLLHQPKIVSESLARYLMRHSHLREPRESKPSVRFYTTGNPDQVAEAAELLFMRPPRFQVAAGLCSTTRAVSGTLATATP